MSDREFVTYAEKRRLRETTVARMRDLGAESCAAVADIAAPLGLNDNQLRDVLDMLEDIAARRRCDVAAVLASSGLSEVLRPDLGRDDRVRALKGHLRRLRYPQLSAAMERIDELRGALQLPRGSRLELPVDLEGDEVVVNVRASSVEQLRSRVAAVGQALARPELETMFALWQEAEE